MKLESKTTNVSIHVERESSSRRRKLKIKVEFISRYSGMLSQNKILLKINNNAN